MAYAQPPRRDRGTCVRDCRPGVLGIPRSQVMYAYPGLAMPCVVVDDRQCHQGDSVGALCVQYHATLLGSSSQEGSGARGSQTV